jgi:plasmid stabilization system protein ParE
VDYRFKVAAQAWRDFNGIWRHIAREDVSNARDFGERLMLKAESLKSFPERHGSFSKRRNIRKLPYRSYIIFYKINKETHTVEILRFWHAARDQRRLRLKEEHPVYEIAVPKAAT